jgi:hypothetical protein
MIDTTTKDPAGSGSDEAARARLERTLGDWRTRIDDLKVQVELGAMDANDALSGKLQVVENSYLAARSSLRRARDSGSDLAAVRREIVRMVRDLKAAYEAANEVIRRSRGE